MKVLQRNLFAISRNNKSDGQSCLRLIESAVPLETQYQTIVCKALKNLPSPDVYPTNSLHLYLPVRQLKLGQKFPDSLHFVKRFIGGKYVWIRL